MSDGTGIEWCDATWNVVIGCDKVSPGCDRCYAIRTAHRMQAHPDPRIVAPYEGTESRMEWTGRVNLVHDRLDMPLRWRKPRRIFVNAQSDLFHDQVPDDFIAKVWAVMALAPRHTFQILTKRHARMRALLNSGVFLTAAAEHMLAMTDADEMKDAGDPFPLPNVWLGVSTENQHWADIRIPALLDTPAAVRFISAEPLLGAIELAPGWLSPPVSLTGEATTQERAELARFCREQARQSGGWAPFLDWVIVGGESGPGARPMHPDWARSLRDQCQNAGVPFLFKQWGEWTPEPGHRYRDWANLDDPHAFVMRVGKKVAGRELDGRTWDQFPERV